MYSIALDYCLHCSQQDVLQKTNQIFYRIGVVMNPRRLRMEKNNIISGCAPTKLRLNTWYATSKSVPPLVDRPCTYTKNVFLCIHRVANKKYLENVDSQSRVTNLTQKNGANW